MCATLLLEPQNTGLTLHYVSKLIRFAISRFPMGVPKKTSPLGLVFFIRCLQRHVINACVVCNCNRCVSPMSHCTLRVRNFVARTPEHWADASLYEQTHSFRYFTIPHGGTKKNKSFGACFFIRCLQRHVINACVVCNSIGVFLPCLTAHFVCAGSCVQIYIDKR